MKVIGIDPGATYCGVVVRDGAELILASTYVKPKDMNPMAWASYAANTVVNDVVSQYPDYKVGIEGVSVPNAYNNGKLSLNSPKWVIWLGMVAGAFAALLPDAVIIRPGKNGSQPVDTYPKALSGRRPKDLLGSAIGAGTRNHEKSAWDVAGEVEFMIKKVVLDQPIKKTGAPKKVVIEEDNNDEPEVKLTPKTRKTPVKKKV
jgi:hypothetical protein